MNVIQTKEYIISSLESTNFDFGGSWSREADPDLNFRKAEPSAFSGSKRMDGLGAHNSMAAKST